MVKEVTPDLERSQHVEGVEEDVPASDDEKAEVKDGGKKGDTVIDNLDDKDSSDQDF